MNIRSIVRPALASLAASTLLLGSATGLATAQETAEPSQEDSSSQAYQFWGYYQLDDSQEWTFAAQGPNETTPEHGSVEGWRFAVATQDDTRFPRDVVTFEEICGSQEAPDGQKNVGVVVDPGRSVDAPEGESVPEPLASCATIPEDGNGLEALGAVFSEVRVDEENGLVCGLAGYPESGCGDSVQANAEQLAPDEDITIAAPAAETDAAETDAAESASAGDDASQTSEATSESESEAASEEDGDLGFPWWAWVLSLAALLAVVFGALKARGGSHNAPQA